MFALRRKKQEAQRHELKSIYVCVFLPVSVFSRARVGVRLSSCAAVRLSVGFFGPRQVIRSRLLARQSLDQSLHASPEAQLVQGIVTPACGNAVVCLMWRDMVYAVVFPWQHQMPVLEQRDPARQAEVGVAPLMDLIGQRHKNCQGEDVAVPRIRRSQGLWCVCEELVGHVSQWEDGDHTVVSIGFNEVVASDGGRVDVVLPERTNKRLANNRDVHRSPRICTPVYHPRRKVCRHYP